MRLQKGFSLIELMIVIAVIGVLMAVALPNYRDYVTRGMIPDAVSNLSTKRATMEQWYQDNRSYLSGAACPATVAPDTTSSKYFDFSCTVITATSYTIQAQGKSNMTGFTYTVDQGNNKRTTAAPAGWALAAMPATCWIKGPGSC